MCRSPPRCGSPLRDDSFDPSSGFDRRFVLPYPHRSPPGLGEVAIGVDISHPISADLLGPVPAVNLRHRPVIWTGVPETPINKDGDPGPRKDDVGLASKRRQGSTVNVVAHAHTV
jgi:hypothetical protein